MNSGSGAQVGYLKPGERVRIVAVEPWDVVTAIGAGPFWGTILSVDESSHRIVVLRLDSLLLYGDMSAEFFLALARHIEGAFFGKLGNTSCNLYSISHEEADKLGTRAPALEEGRISLTCEIGRAT